MLKAPMIIPELTTLSVLSKIGLLTPAGLYRLAAAIFQYGVNPMALLAFSQRKHADQTALVDERESLSYRQLLAQSVKLSEILKENYRLGSGKKVGFLCKNHASLVKAILAVSLTGADICLLNAEMSGSQLKDLAAHHPFSLLIHDFELSPLIEQSGYSKDRLLSDHPQLPAVSNLQGSQPDADLCRKPRLRPPSSGRIILLTGGTTGKSKMAAHKPSVFNFLNPFITLVTRLNLLKYHTAYIATPLYHGYGVAVLFLFLALGRKIVITRGFDAANACELIRKHRVEVVSVVPLMVHRMLRYNPEDLRSLACIASGGAELNPRLVEETSRALGDVLYNLYGTSETGLNMIATPQDLKYSPKTIGKRIRGVGLRILDERKNEVETGKVGQFCIKSRWSMRNRRNAWIGTGDLGYRDEKGYYYLCGRADDMVVSAGENVYPAEIEQVLIRHPQVEDVAVIGVGDESFGQRLKAFVLPVKDAGITPEELLEWLRSRVARYQMPREIVLVEHMPYTPVGKLDKKQLKNCDKVPWIAG